MSSILEEARKAWDHAFKMLDEGRIGLGAMPAFVADHMRKFLDYMKNTDNEITALKERIDILERDVKYLEEKANQS